MGYCGKYAQKWTRTLTMLSTPQEWICRHRKCVCKLFDTNCVYANCLIRIVWYEFNWIDQNGYFHVSPWGTSASDQERLRRLHLDPECVCHAWEDSASDQERLRRLHQDPVKIPVRLRRGNQDPVEVLGQSRPSQATRASVKKHLMACVKWVCPAGCPWGRTAVVFISSEVWHDMFILKPVRRTIIHVPMQW